MRDIRDATCGNVQLSPTTYAYCDPRTLIALNNPELAAQLDARLRGERVSLDLKSHSLLPYRVMVAE